MFFIVMINYKLSLFNYLDAILKFFYLVLSPDFVRDRFEDEKNVSFFYKLHIKFAEIL